MSETLITATDVTKVYPLRGKQEVRALDGVTLDIHRGEYLSIMGPSGSGKSTLFNIIGALDKPTAGDVRIGELSLPALSSKQLAYVRCQYLGYVFQAYNLIPSLSALKNVSLPRVFAGSSPEEADQFAQQRLEQVGLGHRLTHRPDELSGGQQQRVAIARALVNDPAIILADEPTANLDLTTGQQIIDLLRSLCTTSGVTVIAATHDHKMLANSDRVAWVKDGKIEKLRNADQFDIQAGSIETSH